MGPRDLARRIEQRPLIVVPSARDPILIRIGRGNLLASYGAGPSKLYGLAYTTTSIASILAAELDAGLPDITGTDETYTTGLAWGYTTSGSLVFVSNKATPSGGSATQDILAPINVPEGAQVWCRRFVMVPTAADPAVLKAVYLTWRV